MLKQFTATQMANILSNELQVEISAKEINIALKEIGYMKADENGYHMTKEATFFDKSKNIEVPFGIQRDSNGKKYICWNEKTLSNKKLLEFLKESKKLIQKEIKSIEKFEKSQKGDWYKPSRDGAYNSLEKEIIIAEHLGDFKKVEELKSKRVPILRTVQGFSVRSMGECRIMDTLTETYGLKVYSEKQLPSEEVVYSDFFMKFRTEKGLVEIWIELWGKKDEKYLARRKVKEDIYEKQGVILVSLEYSEIMEDLDGLLLRSFNNHPALKKLGMTILDLRDLEMEFVKKFDR